MVKLFLGFSVFCFAASACKNDSSVTEYKDDGDVLAALAGNGASDALLAAGLVIDTNEQIHTQRKSWFAKNMVALSDADSSAAEAPAVPCQLNLQENGVLSPIALEEKMAYPLPQGRVVYCSAGKLSWAIQDISLREKVSKLGVNESELEKVNFFRVPLDAPNSFAALTETNDGVVVIFEGISHFARQNSLDAESVVAGLLAHELGQIRGLRKDNQTNLKSAHERLRSACLVKSKPGASDAATRNSRVDGCRKSMMLNSRQTKYAADQFVVEVVGRKKYAVGVRPTELGKFFRSLSSTGRDPADAHPDAIERAIQFERNLERVGINLLTGGVMRTGETDEKKN